MLLIICFLHIIEFIIGIFLGKRFEKKKYKNNLLYWEGEFEKSKKEIEEMKDQKNRFIRDAVKNTQELQNP